MDSRDGRAKRVPYVRMRQRGPKDLRRVRMALAEYERQLDGARSALGNMVLTYSGMEVVVADPALGVEADELLLSTALSLACYAPELKC